MKRLTIIILLIVSCVLLSVFDGYIADKKADQLDSQLEKIFFLAEAEDETLYENVLSAEKFWEKNEIYFVIVANHTLTDELDENILMLKHYAEINEEHEILAKVSECRSMLKEIAKYDRFALINIL